MMAISTTENGQARLKALSHAAHLLEEVPSPQDAKNGTGQNTVPRLSPVQPRDVEAALRKVDVGAS